MIMTIDGGIIIPSVPPPAMLPMMARRSYPRPSSSWNAIEPTAAAVAIEEPEIALNAVQVPMFVWSSFPGRRSKPGDRAP